MPTIRVLLPVVVSCLSCALVLGQSPVEKHPERDSPVAPESRDHSPKVRTGEEPLPVEVNRIIDNFVGTGKKYHQFLEDRLHEPIPIAGEREFVLGKDWTEQKYRDETFLVRGAVLISTPGETLDESKAHYVTRVEPEEGLAIVFRGSGYVYRAGEWGRMLPDELPAIAPETPPAGP